MSYTERFHRHPMFTKVLKILQSKKDLERRQAFKINGSLNELFFSFKRP
jgi:hypothetical protein